MDDILYKREVRNTNRIERNNAKNRSELKKVNRAIRKLQTDIRNGLCIDGCYKENLDYYITQEINKDY